MTPKEGQLTNEIQRTVFLDSGSIPLNTNHIRKDIVIFDMLAEAGKPISRVLKRGEIPLFPGPEGGIGPPTPRVYLWPGITNELPSELPDLEIDGTLG